MILFTQVIFWWCIAVLAITLVACIAVPEKVSAADIFIRLVVNGGFALWAGLLLLSGRV